MVPKAILKTQATTAPIAGAVFSRLETVFNGLETVFRIVKVGLFISRIGLWLASGSPQQRFLPFYAFTFLPFNAGSHLQKCRSNHTPDRGHLFGCKVSLFN